MRNSHQSDDAKGQQQQQGSVKQTAQPFRPVRLPAVAAAVQTNKPAKPAPSAHRLPACLQDEPHSD